MLPENDRAFLKSIGLSAHEIIVYSILNQANMPMSAQEVAIKFYVYPNAIYRIFEELKKFGLVYLHSKKPLRYKTIDRNIGYQAARKSTSQMQDYFIRQALGGAKYSEEQNIIVGRQEIYDAYVRHSQLAQHDIRLYTIGIAYSDELEIAHQNARKRGVLIWHVIQQNKPSNLYVIHKWQKLGIKMKYLPKDRGFHFYLIDKALVCITFSDPQDTSNRMSIATDNKAAIRLFDSSFSNLWKEAKGLDGLT